MQFSNEQSDHKDGIYFLCLCDHQCKQRTNKTETENRETGTNEAIVKKIK